LWTKKIGCALGAYEFWIVECRFSIMTSLDAGIVMTSLDADSIAHWVFESVGNWHEIKTT